MRYPGLTYIGSGQFAALYGQNETIVDQKAIGLQHLFIDDYQIDLIHTACSVVTLKQKAYFADRVKPMIGHPDRVKSIESSVENHCLMKDVFSYDTFTKTDRVGAHQNHIFFETHITNQSHEPLDFELSALVITQNQLKTTIHNENGIVHVQSSGKCYAIMAQDVDRVAASLDAPSGFMYHGIEDLLFKKNDLKTSMSSTTPIAVSLSKSVRLHPNESSSYRWSIVVGKSHENVLNHLSEVNFNTGLSNITDYWKTWLSQAKSALTYPDETKTMLVSLKAANLNGLLPADLTGHYFANGKVTFYVRDALMGSRAFLYAGFTKEFEQIITFLLACPVKENGEFYQRYTAEKQPDEGANNNVFSQIDTIGYFTRVIADYWELSGKLLIDFKIFTQLISVLHTVQRKNKLFGPEGGVNEGVYGPAFIVSTNMFIVGGVLGAIRIAKHLGHLTQAKDWQDMVDETIQGIESAFLKEGYYAYGYVDYHDEILHKYDTPQFLSASLGYPITDHTKVNYTTLLKSASFFEHGIGYSEQEYHHGPWLFNTCAAAEVAYLLKEEAQYRKIMDWVIDHRNDYGLLPEAIDATNESRAFINPLMWANAEFITAAYIQVIKSLREKP